MRTWNDLLYFDAMPGRYGSIETWLVEMKENAIDRVVCLAPADEIRQKSPPYHLWRQHQTEYEITDVPVPDYGVPVDEAAQRFWEETVHTAQDVREQRKVFVHCGAGIGRTGTFAAGVLLAMGYEPASAIQEISAAGSQPETSRQKAFITSSSRFLEDIEKYDR